MNKKVIILWVITIICLIMTIVFWFLSRNTDVQYEEVKAIVTDTSTTVVTNKNTKNKTNFYKVIVKYNDQEYELHNVHGLAGYSKGRSVTAYLSNGKLYANIEGIKSTTPISIIYFVFLFSTFGLFIYTPTYMSKVKNNKKIS